MGLPDEGFWFKHHQLLREADGGGAKHQGQGLPHCIPGTSGVGMLYDSVGTWGRRICHPEVKTKGQGHAQPNLAAGTSKGCQPQSLA